MPVHNADIAAIFTEIADLPEIQGANPFRIRAYRNAACTLQELGRDVRTLLRHGADLTEPPSIRTILAHLGEPTTPPVPAPRARAPPELEAEWVGTPGLAFDQTLN